MAKRQKTNEQWFRDQKDQMAYQIHVLESSILADCQELAAKRKEFDEFIGRDHGQSLICSSSSSGSSSTTDTEKSVTLVNADGTLQVVVSLGIQADP